MSFMDFMGKTFAIAALGLAPAMANALDAPTGEVVLTITGNITETNNGDQADFDIEMLEALGTESFESTTQWTEGTPTFKGPSLKTVLDAVGAGSTELRATALNDYSIEMDAGTDGFPGPVIATKMNGEPMSVRSKGPLWLVYPYDLDPKFQSEVVFSNSIWQLRSINVAD